MVRVILGGTLKSAAGGRSEFDLEAGDIKQLLTRLGELCPELKPRLEKGVAVSIDGRIYRNAWFEPVPPDSEVFILPRMFGGLSEHITNRRSKAQPGCWLIGRSITTSTTECATSSSIVTRCKGVARAASRPRPCSGSSAYCT